MRKLRKIFARRRQDIDLEGLKEKFRAFAGNVAVTIRAVDVMYYEDESIRHLVEVTYDDKVLVVEPCWLNVMNFHHKAVKRYFEIR